MRIETIVHRDGEGSARPEKCRFFRLKRPRVAGPKRLLLPFFCALFFASGGAVQAATHVSGTISSNTTWSTSGSPYIVDANLTVSAGATLTISPGVVVKFNGTTRTMFVNGVVSAIGNAGSRIVFTSLQDDSIGGDSGGDGATSGAPGQWFMIQVKAPGSQFQFVDIRYGGNGSSDIGYGSLEVSGSTATATIQDSTITYSQRSGLRVGGGTATVQRTMIEHNAVGVADNGGVVNLEESSKVQNNTKDGVWFNLVSTYSGAASKITATDITGNGEDGIDVQVDRTLNVSKWPHGNGNNIFGNTGKQLKLSGYHPSSYATQYAVDWSGNYWGDDVYYWSAPSLCLGTAPYSPGHLAYTWSHPAPGPGGAETPPDGPISYNTYLASGGGNVAYCAYDRFQAGGQCGFSSSFLRSSIFLISFATPQTLGDALGCAEETDYALLGVLSDSATECSDVRTGYAVDSAETFSDILAAYESFIESLIDEFNSFADVSCAYSGSAPVSNLVVDQVESAGNYLDDATSEYLAGYWNCSADPWMPTGGRIDVGPSYRPGYTDQRYVYQTFHWDEMNWLYLQTCSDRTTLEPDAVFNNSDGDHYLGDERGWASNLPGKYLDTQLFDDPALPTYTVGSLKAEDIVEDKPYFTLIRTAQGNASSDTGKLLLQGGMTFPAACESLWCVFPVETKALVDPWDITVPGSKSWSWND